MSRRRLLPLALGIAAAMAAACIPPYEMTGVVPSGRACPVPTTDGSAGGMSWYFPLAEADNVGLERWCATVGDPVVHAKPAGSFGGLHTGELLTIAVWNPDAGSGDVMSFLERELGLVCSGAESTLRAGSTHFVLLGQETLRRSNDIPDVPKRWETLRAVDPARSDSVLDVLDVARQCGLSLVYAPSVRNGWESRDGKREDKGNAILSTLQLSDPIAVELPLEGARRLMVAATVHTARGDSLRLASVHLETTAGLWRLVRTGNAARLRQALAIIDVLDRIEAERGGSVARVERGEPGITTILGGDFNIWTTKETGFRHLLEHFPSSPPPLTDGTRGPYPTDHILVRRATVGSQGATLLAATYRRIDREYGSDHRPSIAWLRFDR